MMQRKDSRTRQVSVQKGKCETFGLECRLICTIVQFYATGLHTSHLISKYFTFVHQNIIDVLVPKLSDF